jgi:hypothetical protein
VIILARIRINTEIIQEEIKYNGETILTYKVMYPEFRAASYQMSLNLINTIYKNKALEYQNYCKNEFYNKAVEQYKYNKEHGIPILVHEALVVFKVTYDEDCALSIYCDMYEYDGGAHGKSIRYSHTWNLQKYDRLTLDQLINCSTDYEEYILKQIKEQIDKDPSIFFDEYEKLIAKAFIKENFYCTTRGIVIYYQEYAIAPYSSGIREFLIPYTNCVQIQQESVSQ